MIDGFSIHLTVTLHSASFHIFTFVISILTATVVEVTILRIICCSLTTTTPQEATTLRRCSLRSHCSPTSYLRIYITPHLQHHHSDGNSRNMQSCIPKMSSIAPSTKPMFKNATDYRRRRKLSAFPRGMRRSATRMGSNANGWKITSKNMVIRLLLLFCRRSKRLRWSCSTRGL